MIQEDLVWMNCPPCLAPQESEANSLANSFPGPQSGPDRNSLLLSLFTTVALLPHRTPIHARSFRVIEGDKAWTYAISHFAAIFRS